MRMRIAVFFGCALLAAKPAHASTASDAQAIFERVRQLADTHLSKAPTSISFNPSATLVQFALKLQFVSPDTNRETALRRYLLKAAALPVASGLREKASFAWTMLLGWQVLGEKSLRDSGLAVATELAGALSGATPRPNEPAWRDYLDTEGRISAARTLLYAYQVKPSPERLAPAERLLRRVASTAVVDGLNIRPAAEGGNATPAPWATFPFYFTSALLDLYEIVSEDSVLNAAEDIAKSSSSAMEREITERHDPYLTYLQCLTLERLFALTADMSYYEQWQTAWDSLVRYWAKADLGGAPNAWLGWIGRAILTHPSPPLHVTILGRKNDKEAKAMYARALEWPHPFVHVQWLDPKTQAKAVDRLGYASEPEAAAYICQGLVCLSMVKKSDRLDQFKKDLMRKPMGLRWAD